MPLAVPSETPLPGGLAALDRDAFYAINHGWSHPVLDAFFPFITRLGNFVPVIVLLVGWLAWRGGRRGRLCLLALALSVGINDPLVVRVVKPAVERERPCVALSDANLRVSRRTSPSFPSAHAANMFGVAVVFGAFYRRSRWIVVPFATLVALSRVYIGVHYPLDIVAGALLGSLVAALVLGVLTLAGRRVPWLDWRGAVAAAMFAAVVAVPGRADVGAPSREGENGAPGTFAERIVAAAVARTAVPVVYDGRYRAIEYPGGDVPDSIGVCTDLVIRSFRAVGVDLQREVHEDMQDAFDRYPDLWGLSAPDRNIDHRRVPNLETFLERRGAGAPVTTRGEDYAPGDLVTWRLPGNLPHVGIVIDRRTAEGRPLVVHNIGRGPEIEDVLFAYEITGHYRWDPDARAP